MPPKAPSKSAKQPTQVSLTTPGLGRRQENKREKHLRIAAAAWALFKTKGFEATTTTQVAQKAKVAKGTLFLYAPDKDELVFLVMHDRLAERSDALFASLPRAAPLLEQLLHLFGGLCRLYGESGEVGRRFVRALPGATGPNAARVNMLTFSFLHRVAALISDAQARGEVRAAVEPLRAAQNLFALYFAGVLLWVSRMLPVEAVIEPFLRESFALQLDGLRA